MNDSPFGTPETIIPTDRAFGHEHEPDLDALLTDEVEEQEDALETSDLPADAPEDERTGETRTSAARGITRAQIRRVAVKAQEIVDTPDRIRQVAGHLVGAGTGVAELTTAIMSAERGATQSISDLNTIAEAEPMEAGVIAGALGRSRLKSVWALLAALEAGPKGNIPAADAKAAIAVAKAVFALDDSAKSDLAAVVAVLKKN